MAFLLATAQAPVLLNVMIRTTAEEEGTAATIEEKKVVAAVFTKGMTTTETEAGTRDMDNTIDGEVATVVAVIIAMTRIVAPAGMTDITTTTGIQGVAETTSTGAVIGKDRTGRVCRLRGVIMTTETTNKRERKNQSPGIKAWGLKGKKTSRR